MKIVASSLHFTWREIRESLGNATRELGLDGIEFSWHETFCRPHCTREDIDVLASLRGSHEANLSAHIWNNLAENSPSAAEAALLNWLHICGRTGVNNLVIHGGSYADRREGIRRIRRVMEQVLPEFERSNVTLNLENHYAFEYHDCHELLSEAWEFKELFRLDSPSLKFCFDTGHGNMTGNTMDLLHSLRPWLKYVHLADNKGKDDDHLPYGKGSVAWQEIFITLRQNTFDGIFCIEFPVHGDRKPLDSCVKNIRGIWSGTNK